MTIVTNPIFLIWVVELPDGVHLVHTTQDAISRHHTPFLRMCVILSYFYFYLNLTPQAISSPIITVPLI